MEIWVLKVYQIMNALYSEASFATSGYLKESKIYFQIDTSCAF